MVSHSGNGCLDQQIYHGNIKQNDFVQCKEKNNYFKLKNENKSSGNCGFINITKGIINRKLPFLSSVNHCKV